MNMKIDINEIVEGDVVSHVIYGKCNIIKLKDRGDELFIYKQHPSGGSVTSLLSLTIEYINEHYSKPKLDWVLSNESLPPIPEDINNISSLKNLVLVKQSNGNMFTACNFSNGLWYSHPLYFSIDNTSWCLI